MELLLPTTSTFARRLTRSLIRPINPERFIWSTRYRKVTIGRYQMKLQSQRIKQRHIIVFALASLLTRKLNFQLSNAKSNTIPFPFQISTADNWTYSFLVDTSTSKHARCSRGLLT